MRLLNGAIALGTQPAGPSVVGSTICFHSPFSKNVKTTVPINLEFSREVFPRLKVAISFFDFGLKSLNYLLQAILIGDFVIRWRWRSDFSQVRRTLTPK